MYVDRPVAQGAMTAAAIIVWTTPSHIVSTPPILHANINLRLDTFYEYLYGY